MSIVLLRGPEPVQIENGPKAVTGTSMPGAVRAGLVERAAGAGKAMVMRNCRSRIELIDCLERLRASNAELLLLDPGACGNDDEPLRRALHKLDVPYIEVHDDDMAAPEPSIEPHCGRRLSLVHGYAAQSYTLALSIALEHLGCAESGYGVHVGT